MRAQQVRVLTTAQAPPALLAQVRALLDEAFDGTFTDDDWDHTVGGHHAVVVDGGAPVAHAAVVGRILDVGGEVWRTGYVEGVATHPSRQGGGLGSLAMRAVMQVLRDRFDLGALSTERHTFYERLGWERWRGATWVRDGAQLTRTAEEDGGIMVWRFGASAGIDRSASLTCEVRAGDDW
jgi:aminoglycoside 2'-N-acetyltransferase I